MPRGRGPGADKLGIRYLTTQHSQSILSCSDYRTFKKRAALSERFLELRHPFSISIRPFSASSYLQSKYSEDFAFVGCVRARLLRGRWGQPLPHSPHTGLMSRLMVPHTPRGHEKIYYSHNELFREGRRGTQTGAFSLSEGRAAWLWFWGLGSGAGVQAPAQGQRVTRFALPASTEGGVPGFLTSLHTHGAKGEWQDLKALSGQTPKIGFVNCKEEFRED